MPFDPARFVLTLSCGDHREIVAAVATCFTAQDCHTVESAPYGATGHCVAAELDAGPIVEQDVERVDPSMSVEALIATGQDIEATVLARAVRFHLGHRV